MAGPKMRPRVIVSRTERIIGGEEKGGRGGKTLRAGEGQGVVRTPEENERQRRETGRDVVLVHDTAAPKAPSVTSEANREGGRPPYPASEAVSSFKQGDAAITSLCLYEKIHDKNFLRDPSFVNFMTGGNRTHNRTIHQMVTQEAIRILEERRGAPLSAEEAAQVREFVHQEAKPYKDNGPGQRNGNAGHSNFREILENTVAHFGGRLRTGRPSVLETSEDMHAHIEHMIDEALPGSGPEALRASLRTRLRAEFAGILMNEWGSERLEDIIGPMRAGITREFGARAEAILRGQFREHHRGGDSGRVRQQDRVSGL